MSINHFVVHRIFNTHDSKIATELRQDELQANDLLEEFTAAIKQAYMSRISREHGKFGTEDGAVLLANLLDQVAKDEISFLQLSEQIIAELKNSLETLKQEINGHLIFFQEKIYENEYFYLIVAKQRESLTINGELEVQTVHSIDLGPSLVVAKVDLTEWKKNQGNAYLTITVPRADKPFAEAFRSSVGFSDGINKVEGTQALLETVETFTKNVPDEQVNAYRTQVVDYCMEQEAMDTPVELNGLSQAVESVNVDEFSRYLADNLPGGEQQIRMDRKSLRNYVKFAGREKDLAVSFSSHQLNKRINYNAGSDTLSITGLPKSLREQLLRHLKVNE